MHLLTSTSHVLRAVTGAAASIGVKVSAMDNSSGTVSPYSPANQVISSAATTTICAAPSSGVQRNIKNCSLENMHATLSCPITVQDYDGTTAVDVASCTLLPSEKLALDDTGVWRHYAADGSQYTYSGPPVANLGPTSTLAETMPRETCPEVNTTGPATGVLWMQAIYLRAGQVITGIELWSATTAAGTPTHQMAGLYDSSRNLLATSADATTAAWAANSAKQFALTSSYRVPASGLYYIGFFTTATTVPTFKGGTAKTGGQLAGAAPIIGGTSSSTGLTTALPNPAGAITASTGSIYARVY